MSKASKRLRDCPALGRAITPAECGAGRGSAYQCPVECPFFPFTPANYEKDHAGQVVEQLVRPTGLIDPEVEVRPATHQVDDANQVHVETQALLRLMDQVKADAPDSRRGRESYPPLCVGAADLFA